MSIAVILVHDAIGELRAVACDSEDKPVALFHDRWCERNIRARLGQVYEGHIRKCAQMDGGAFITLSQGEEGFLARRDLTGLVEGAAAIFQVAAEARPDKLAKLVEVETLPEEGPGSSFNLWRASLPGGIDAVINNSPDVVSQIAHVFEDALSPVVPLAGGGRLQITPTPALIAIDVDTIGRKDKGRATARARAVNRDAAEVLARQASLRNLGGALVLDCIAPIARQDRPLIKAKFLDTFRQISTRRAESLAPSPFGLMEVVLERGAIPIHEACLDANGVLTPLSQMLEGMRKVEQEAFARRGVQLCLSLPDRGYEAFLANRNLYQDALNKRFGNRINVVLGARDKIEVEHL